MLKRKNKILVVFLVSLLLILLSGCTIKQEDSSKVSVAEVKAGKHAEALENYAEVFVENIEIGEAFAVVSLKDKNSNLSLPIFMSRSQGELIFAALHNASFPRPIAHDLIYSALRLAGLKPAYVSVDELKGSTYFGSIAVETGEKEIELIDSRPSDAIIFALKYRLPIFANKSLLEEHRGERAGKAIKEIEI